MGYELHASGQQLKTIDIIHSSEDRGHKFAFICAFEIELCDLEGPFTELNCHSSYFQSLN